YSRPFDKLIGLVEEPLRRAPKRQIDEIALLLVIQRRKGRGFLERPAIALIDPEVERVICHHPEHQPVAEDAGLAEHAPNREMAERGELLAQELGKAVACNHSPPLSLV